MKNITNEILIDMFINLSSYDLDSILIGSSPEMTIKIQMAKKLIKEIAIELSRRNIPLNQIIE